MKTKTKKTIKFAPPPPSLLDLVQMGIVDREKFFKEELGYTLNLFRDSENPEEPSPYDAAMMGTVTEPYPAAVYDKRRLIQILAKEWKMSDKEARDTVDSYQFIGFHQMPKGYPLVMTDIYHPELMN